MSARRSTPDGRSAEKPVRLAIFATHPVQYQAPLWRGLSQQPDFQVKVYYFSDQGLNGQLDPGFGRAITWDVPLLDGYDHEFLSKGDMAKQYRFSIADPATFLRLASVDVVLVHGYMHHFTRQLIHNARRFRYNVVLRGDFTDMKARQFAPKRLARSVYLRWFYSHVDQFCSVGVDATAHLRRFGIPPERITRTPYSVDDGLIDGLKQGQTRESARAMLGIPSDVTVVLFSGKLIPRKQPLLLAGVLAQLTSEFPKLFPVFLGSGEQESELRRMLATSFPGGHLCPGFVNQTGLAPHFMAADVFVLPSTYDTWGLVVNEAMHYGLPCIVSEMVGAGRDLVENGKTGYVFGHDSPRELEVALRRVLSTPEHLRALSTNASKRISGYRIEDTVRGMAEAVRTARSRSSAQEFRGDGVANHHKPPPNHRR